MSALTLSITDYFSVASQQAGGPDSLTQIDAKNVSSKSEVLTEPVTQAIRQVLSPPSDTFVLSSGSATHPFTDQDDAFYAPRVMPDAPLEHEIKNNTSKAASAAAERPLLRKLKLSLKLGLQRLYSAATISPKSVRFATRLENVKMFDGRDSPAAVSTTTTPVGSPRGKNFGLDYFSHQNPSFGDIFSESEDEREFDRDTEWKYVIRNLDFVAPSNVYDKMDTPVYLLKCSLLKNGQLLILVVMCKNLAFEKSLAAKVTFNNWQSNSLHTNFTYVKSFATTGFDQFQCVVPLEHLSPYVKLQFCFQYTVCGKTYWDNNGGQNFHVSLEKETTTRTPPLDSFTYRAPTFDFYSSPDSSLNNPLSFGKVWNTPPIITTKEKTPAESKLLTPPPSKEAISKREKPQAEGARPTLHHSSSEPCLRPRYSKSFRAKQQTKADAELPEGGDRNPEKNFEDAIFNSSTYTALLQRYCFNGSEARNVSGMDFGVSSNPFKVSGHDLHSVGESIYI